LFVGLIDDEIVKQSAGLIHFERCRCAHMVLARLVNCRLPNPSWALFVYVKLRSLKMMRIARERNFAVITIIAVCTLATVVWFAGVTSHAALPQIDARSASAGDAPITPALIAADAQTRLRTTGEYGKIPLGFEANQGQTDAQVQFLSRGAGYTVFLTPTSAVLALRQRDADSQKAQFARGKRPANVLRMSLVGANPSSKATAVDQLPGKSNYFIGNDPTKWRVDVPSYARVSYEDIYEGVDLVYYGNQRQLENDFVVAPGVDPRVIAMEFGGAKEIAIGKAGDLLLQTADGQVQMQKPVVYQLIAGTRHEVAGNYVLRNRETVGFEIAAYDHTAPLVIDPVLVYSTFLGGAGQDSGSAIAVDSAGNAYISGEAGAATFPTQNSNQAFSGGNDAIVSKFNATGSALVYSTFLGGNTGFEHGYAIAVDSAGAAYVVGITIASDFPITASALQTTKLTGATQEAAFLTKLSPAGTLAYSTFLSGTQAGRGFGVATDGAGNAYVVGTAGTAFPVTASAFSSTTTNTGFLTKLNTNASGAASLVYSTFLGPTGFAEPRAVAVDATGNAYITGNTNSTSTNFTSAGAFQTVFGGGTFDAFVAKFNTNLSGAASRVYSTYLGGSLADTGGQFVAKGTQAIAIDAAGNAYVTGQTASTNFPTANAFQPANGGTTDAFLTKLNASGSALVYSTYIGGSGSLPDEGRAVAVNVVGNAYVIGYAQAPNFPTANPITPVSATGSVFVSKFTPAGDALVYSTRLGATLSQDAGNGIALDSAGNAFVTGDARTGYPVVAAFQGTSGGNTDAFASLIADPTIIGRVVDENGNPISTATVNLTGVPAATTTTDANGFFTFGLLTVSNNYTVSVTVANYIFTAQVVNNLQKNVRLNFSPVVFSISGQVTNSGSGLGGATMTLSDGKALTTTTNGSGAYSFANLPAGRNYTVAPSLVGFFFMPVNRAFTNLLANQTADFAVAFEATLNSWTYQGRTYVYVKLSFPDSGFNVTDWGVPAKTGNDFSVNAAVARLSGPFVQAVTTTAQIYDLGPLANGNYTFTFRSAATTVRTLQFAVSSTVPPPNPIDDARQFVKQQYRDFLNREADQAGEDFWTDNIAKCSDPARRPAGQTEAQCTLRQRETTSGAFFLSPEFQYTGYFVYRMYQGGLGRQPKLSEFIPDALIVGNGIVVNGQLSGAKINQNKAAFAAQFVNCTDATRYRCAEFKAIYDPLNNTQYVDKLFLTTGVNASATDRTALVSGLNGGTETRATVLQKVVDGINVISEGNQQFTTTYGQAFYDQQFNRAFVQLEYFGYMKRDPDDAGYAFWLSKLNQFGGNFVNAEMVLAFISSPEYRARFGQP
jgi:hypothetical protein